MGISEVNELISFWFLVSQNIVSGFQPGITTLLTHGPTFRS